MAQGGHCATVGIGRFLLQGGQGWDQRGWAAEAARNASGAIIALEQVLNPNAEPTTGLASPQYNGLTSRFGRSR